MDAVETRRSLRRVLSGWRNAGERVALVPTMGNLHAGHLSLVRAAREHADRVVASIYVNPTQFGEGEDFERYPRTLEADLASLDAARCDLAFTPQSEALYPYGVDQAVMLRASPDLSSRLEGRFRPGHFDGVVTVVARLFAVVGPDVAVFGEKDYQQLLVIRRMARDLGFNIEIIGAPTVRAESGLALSSRNAYLEGEQLDAARALNQVLARTVREAEEAGAPPLADLERSAAQALEQIGLKVDYVAIRRAADLERPGERPGEWPAGGDSELRILAAAWCGKTRLIDNLALRSSTGKTGK